MTDHRWCCRLVVTLAILAAAVGASMAASPAAMAQHQGEYIRHELVLIQPAIAGGAPAGEIAALLNLPASWSIWDAAAILVNSPQWPASARNQLRAGLLDQGAAVLELDPHDILADLFGALLALREEVGAGIVVAFGYGEAMLHAAEEAIATRHLGLGGSRFAATGAFGSGRPVFAAGAAPPAAEQWPIRAPLLCAVVAEAVAEAARRDCLAALLPTPRAIMDVAPSSLALGR